MPLDASQLASGGQQAPQAGTTTTPQQTNVGMDISKVLQVLGNAIQQCVNPQGFVDMQKLITIWPQIAQQGGVNIPFQTVMQLIQQNPQLISELVVRYGLNGIIMNGQHISAEQLAGIGSGATGSSMAPRGG